MVLKTNMAGREKKNLDNFPIERTIRLHYWVSINWFYSSIHQPDKIV